jgi:hypothetical protein
MGGAAWKADTHCSAALVTTNTSSAQFVSRSSDRPPPTLFVVQSGIEPILGLMAPNLGLTSDLRIGG